MSNTDTNLRDYIMRAREGDKLAYKKLLEELVPLLRRLLYKPLAQYGHQSLLEDILQETLLAIHLKLHTYDLSQSFIAWVRTVLKHKMIDMLRRQKKNTFSLDEETFGEIADPFPPVDPSLSRDLNSLLSQLKPPAGELIYALKVEGTSIKDLASQFKLSESNIKVLIHRGLQKLADLAINPQGRIS